MAEKTLTQFLDDYESFYNESKSRNVAVEDLQTYIKKNLDKLVAECTDDNGRLDLCDSRIFFEGAFSENNKKPDERIYIPEIVISAPVKVIPKEMFYRSKIEKITLPDGLQKIDGNAFSGCENLTEIKLPNGLQKIEEYAFSGCENLTKINIPDGLQKIGDCAFFCCENLREIKLPAGLREIGNLAFWGCENLRKVNLPDGLKEIGESAFFGCTNLTRINIPDGLQKIGKSAFYGCENLKTLEVPANTYVHPNFNASYERKTPIEIIRRGQVSKNMSSAVNNSVFSTKDTRVIVDGDSGSKKIYIEESGSSDSGCGCLILIATIAIILWILH